MEPKEAKVLLPFATYGCSKEIATILAMLQGQNIFLNIPNKKRAANHAKLFFSTLEGDAVTYLDVYMSFIDHGKMPKWYEAPI